MASRSPQSAAASSAQPTARRRRRRRGWRRLLFVVLVFGVVAVGSSIQLLSALPIPEPAGADETTIVFDRHGTPIAHLHAEQNRIPVSLEQVSPILIDAVISSEDRDFFRHPGVDPVAIGRAAWTDIRQQGELQGGSTITQQYVKNAFLEPDRTLMRKLREAVLALRIERELSKEEILERYLNVIYLGRGAYGVEAAAQVWFGRSAADLDISQSAYLAALIRAPELADVSRPEQAELAHQRRDSVLSAMLEEGYITAEEHDAAQSISLHATTLPRRENSSVQVLVENAGLEHPVEMVRQQLIAEHGAVAVFAGGLRVTTTLDVEMQLNAFATSRQVTSQEGAPEAAIVVLDDQGHVRAMVGGSDFSVSQVNLATGVAGGGGGRQPGSIAKTLAVASALEQGLSLDSLLPAPDTLVVPNADGGEDWVVENSTVVDGAEITMREALVTSVNTAFASLASRIDLGEVVELSGDLGVSAPLEPFPSLALGAQEVSVLDMATAYSVFMNGGELRVPTIVSEVLDSDGELLERSAIDRRGVLDGSTSALVTEALREVVARGTGTQAAVEGVDIAGKTGTSQEHRDAWFVGFSDRYTAAVWLGFPDDGRPMVDVLGLPAVSGGTWPALMFAELMGELHRADLRSPSAPTTVPPTTEAPPVTLG